MRKLYLSLCLLLVSSFLLANTITVNTTMDEDDGMLGGGSGISLREAINHSTPGDIIELAVSTTYTLTISAGNEESNLTQGSGDLDIQHNLTINGNGATINADMIDRVLQIESSVTVTINNLTITGGDSNGNPSLGGGVYNQGTLNLNVCTITNNRSTTGGGNASTFGGGIYNEGTLTMTNCTVSNNTVGTANAGQTGGGIFNSSTATLNMTACTVSGNMANQMSSNGGGILNDNDGTMTLLNCTISGNQANQLGGGISFNSNSSTINFCTITDNTANNGGGLHTASGGDGNVSNTIIAGNMNNGSNAAFADIQNRFGSTGHNLIGIVANNMGYQSTDILSTDTNNPINPNLGPLQDNGGNTFTHALLNPSPAYNAADGATAVTTDQTGATRVQLGAPDIGAYESSTVLPVELTFFKGQATTKGNALQWQTASEFNNHGFEVQRSPNGKEWKKFGFVAGNGTTVETQDYAFLDTDLVGFQSGSVLTLYYRLKQIDFDGSYEYSDVVAINYELGMTKDELMVFPNPSTDVLNYQVANLEAVQGVQLFDVFGKLVKVAEQADGQLSLADLTAGIYVLVVEWNDDSLRQIIVKQ